MLVEIWSDVVCPWCAVGKARFEAALDGLPAADDVQVRWRSFELDPAREAVSGEVDYLARLASKYSTSRDQAQAMVDRMTAAGAADGIEFRFERARPGNTFDAHRVLHLAAARGRQYQVKDRFLAGYHTEGVAIDDHEELVRLASEAGLEPTEVQDVLSSDDWADEVRADEETARQLGIRGVPFFVLDRTWGLSGAQPAEVLRRALDRAMAESRGPGAPIAPRAGHEPAGPDHAHAPGERCVDGVCAV